MQRIYLGKRSYVFTSNRRLWKCCIFFFLTVASRVLNDGVSECVHVTSLVCICRTDPGKKEKQEFLFISTNMEVAGKLYVKKLLFYA